MFAPWNIEGVKNSEELWTIDPDEGRACKVTVHPDGARTMRTSPGVGRLSRLNARGESEVVNDTTQAILYAMIITGVAELTTDNWREFFAMVRMIELAGGALRKSSNGRETSLKQGQVIALMAGFPPSPDTQDILIEPADVLRLIGLKVPASGMEFPGDKLAYLLAVRARAALEEFEAAHSGDV